MNLTKIFFSSLLVLISISLASAAVTLNSPIDTANTSSPLINFNCSATSITGLANITLYGNWTGIWTANETKSVSGTSNTSVFTKAIPEGNFVWNCQQEDILGTKSLAPSNFTFDVDRTLPSISTVLINESYLCGTSSEVRVNCTATDSLTGVDNITINAQGPSVDQNYTASILSGNTYYSDIPITQTGIWNFTCFASDFAGNLANKTSSNFQTYYTTPDLTLYPSDITFSLNNPSENIPITISALIRNNGCQDANNFWVSFYDGDPSLGGFQIGTNKSISVPQRSNTSTNISWTTVIGPTNFFVIPDFNNSIVEGNETNNKANNTIEVTSWQDFYGNISSSKALGNSLIENMTLWLNESTSTGVIFIADKESIIHWNSLYAIGRDTSNNAVSNDFSDLDAVFNMTGFNDSISNKFTTDGSTPKATENFTIQSRIIPDVPIINSTNNTNFITGILWDASSDTDNQFDQTDKEKVVFATKINKDAQGAYGKYDYEITIPVRLRDQNTADTSEVYFYYELN